MTPIEVLEQSTVSGNVVKLPDTILERDIYTKVKKMLESTGGKWKGGKTAGFVFDFDPTDHLKSLIESGGTVKKDFQFFPTPAELADRLVNLAKIRELYSVLEPSAGQGAIVHAIHRQFPKKTVHVYELMDANLKVLNCITNISLQGKDFLESPVKYLYDRIVANPPFSKNQDIDHIKKMYEHLKPGGRLVSVASKHWIYSVGRKEMDFKKWLMVAANLDLIELPKGAFRSSGTEVETVIVIIDKP